jgi:hypothetical protein
LKVPEYFQFDPTEDYLTPPLQGQRLVDGEYLPIAAIDGRLPSAVLGLHLEREGRHVRLHDPSTGRRLLTRPERTIEDGSRIHQLEDEVAQLRRELEEALRRKRANGA